MHRPRPGAALRERPAKLWSAPETENQLWTPDMLPLGCERHRERGRHPQAPPTSQYMARPISSCLSSSCLTTAELERHLVRPRPQKADNGWSWKDTPALSSLHPSECPSQPVGQRCQRDVGSPRSLPLCKLLTEDETGKGKPPVRTPPPAADTSRCSNRVSCGKFCVSGSLWPCRLTRLASVAGGEGRSPCQHSWRPQGVFFQGFDVWFPLPS